METLKRKFKKPPIKKALAMLMALIIGLMLPLTAFASTVNRSNWISGYYYNVNGHYGQMQYLTVDNKPVYCINFGKTLNNNTVSSQNIKDNKYFQTLTKPQQNGIKGATIYGYPNISYKTLGAKNYEEAYVATAAISWEYELGFRTSASATSATSGLSTTGQNAFYKQMVANHPGCLRAYKAILKGIANHRKVQSYAVYNESTKAKEYEMKYNSSTKQYELTLNDLNNIAANSISSPNKYLNIKYVSAGSYKFTSSKPISKSNPTLITVVKRTPDTSKQAGVAVIGAGQECVSGVLPDPVKSYVKLYTTGQITLTKTLDDNAVSSTAQAFKFTISNKSINYSKTVSITVPANKKSASVNITGLSLGYTYTITETLASKYITPTFTYNGKTSTSKSYNITLNNSAARVTVSAKNTEIANGTIRIHKTDGDVGQALQGVVYGVFTSSGTKLGEMTTGADGYASMGGLKYGNYYAQELKAQPGYLLDSTKYNFSITKNGQTINQNHTNTQKGRIEIFKYSSSADNTALAGCHFSVYADEDLGKKFSKGDLIEELVTNENGYASSGELILGKYKLVETQSSDGYLIGTENVKYVEVKSDTVTTVAIDDVTVTKNAEDYVVVDTPPTPEPTEPTEGNTESGNVESENTEVTPPTEPITYEYGNATVSVISSANNVTPVVGVDVSCYYKHGDTKVHLASGVTNEKGQITFKHLAKGVEYTFEQKSKSKYFVQNTKEHQLTLTSSQGNFEIKNDVDTSKTYVGAVEQVAFYNAPIEVTITKMSTDGSLLPDTEYLFYTSDGDLFADKTTDADGKIVLSPVPAGDYTFKEKTPKPGYQLDTAEYSFTVNADGTVTGTTTVTDKPTEFVIHKTDITGAKGLPGAKIKITGLTVDYSYTAVTDADGNITLKGLLPGEYQFEEELPPSGFAKNNNVFNFIIDENGFAHGSGDIKDELNSWTIYKTDVSTSEGLAGATIKVTGDNGFSVTGKTDKDGKFELKGLAPGTYHFEETEAPNNYYLNKTIFTFVVHKDGSITGDNAITDKRKVGLLQVGTTHLTEEVETGHKLLTAFAFTMLATATVGAVVTRKGRGDK